MDASDKAIGRKLVAIARHSPFELVDAIAWGLGHELRGGWRCPGGDTVALSLRR